MRGKKYNNLYYLLRTVPGIGPLTAASLITEIGDINRFKDFYHLNSFTGLLPMEHSSGEKEIRRPDHHKKTPSTKERPH